MDNDQFLHLLFRAAEAYDPSEDGVEAYIATAAYEHAAASESPIVQDFSGYQEILFDSWCRRYRAWVALGRPSLVDVERTA